MSRRLKGALVISVTLALIAVPVWTAAMAEGSEGQLASPPEMVGNIDLARAAQYFGEFDALCTADAGKLWGVSFCGPFLLVDPATRMVAANRADGKGVLSPRAGVFAGELPADLGIANTAVDWAGSRWTMVIWWSLGGGVASRASLMAHEAFHRLQPSMGLVAVGEMNAHLDSLDGRLWLQLEWNALEEALEAEGKASREAVADALIFRAARRELFPEAAAREIPLEIFEGLAEYSGMRLAGFSAADVVRAVSDKRENATGFVRSFAYISGPLYGFLLDESAGSWRRQVTNETDLGVLLAGSMDGFTGATGVLEEAQRRAADHGGKALRAAENKREAQRQEQLAAWRAALMDGPVLVVDLTRVSSGSFNPRKVFPFAEGQTVYSVRELIGEWGVLTVDDGAILEDDAAGWAHVSLAGAAADGLSGTGWSLQLNEGWSILPGPRDGDFEVGRPPDSR